MKPNEIKEYLRNLNIEYYIEDREYLIFDYENNNYLINLKFHPSMQLIFKQTSKDSHVQMEGNFEDQIKEIFGNLLRIKKINNLIY